MQATNYSAELIKSWSTGFPNITARDRHALEVLKGKLCAAEHFMLPDCGNILPRPGTELPNISDIIRPPFPFVALEYTAVNGREMGQISSPKRLVLAECEGDGVVLTPFAYIGPIKKWAPPTISIKFQYDVSGERMIYSSWPVTVDLCEEVSRKTYMHPSDLMKSWMQDAVDEMNAYFDLCQALACSNVGTEIITAPVKLNAKRAKLGKPPLRDYRILTIGASLRGRSSNGGGHTERTVRSHLRRGHIRRLNSGKRTWVNACLVNGGSEGFLQKSYRIS